MPRSGFWLSGQAGLVGGSLGLVCLGFRGHVQSSRIGSQDVVLYAYTVPRK